MKKITITLNDIFQLPSAVIYNPDNFKPFSAVTIDSRNVPANSLFVAIKGEKFDGHKFIKDAVNKGAAAILINEKMLNKIDDVNTVIITVNDTTTALGNLAKIWRSKLSTKIIAITGSNGKTSTKEILALLLSEKYKVNKTLVNNNNHIGVPLTLFATSNKHDLLVLELGTNHFGETKYSAGISKPDYALITNIGNSHLEFLKNKKGVLREKIAVIESAIENNGTIFINNDDALLKKVKTNYPSRITFGMVEEADVKTKIKSYTEEGLPVVEIKSAKISLTTEIPIHGELNVKNFCAAAAVAINLGVTKKQILAAIKKIKPVEKRFNIKKFKNFIVVDDTYNANPESMKFALEMVSKIFKTKKKIVVLGDMFELGTESLKHHQALVKQIKKARYDAVYITGKMMGNIFRELESSAKVEVKYFFSRKMLNTHLQKIQLNNSVILVKGSRGMKMEEFVKVLEERAAG